MTEEPVVVDNMKEINEAFDALDLLAEQTGKIVEGGIDLSDLSHLIPLATKFDTLKNGVEGISDINIKEMNEADVVATVMRAYGLAKKVLAIKK